MKLSWKIEVSLILIFSFAVMPAVASDSEFILKELQRADWEVRLMNGASLEKMREPQSIETLIEIIDNRRIDWRLQIRGIRLLGKIHTPRVEDFLLRLFSDAFFHHGCPAVRSSIALTLGNFSGPRVVNGLIEGLEDPELQVREATIVSLGRVGDVTAVPYLIAQLKDMHFVIKVSAIRSLGLLRDARAVSSLERIAGNAVEPLLKREASIALSMIRKQS